MHRNRMKPSHRRQVRGLHRRIHNMWSDLTWVQHRKEYWQGRAIRAEYQLRCLKSRMDGLQVHGLGYWHGILCGVIGMTIGQMAWHVIVK